MVELLKGASGPEIRYSAPRCAPDVKQDVDINKLRWYQFCSQYEKLRKPSSQLLLWHKRWRHSSMNDAVSLATTRRRNLALPLSPSDAVWWWYKMIQVRACFKKTIMCSYSVCYLSNKYQHGHNHSNDQVVSEHDWAVQLHSGDTASGP